VYVLIVHNCGECRIEFEFFFEFFSSIGGFKNATQTPNAGHSIYEIKKLTRGHIWRSRSASNDKINILQNTTQPISVIQLPKRKKWQNLQMNRLQKLGRIWPIYWKNVVEISLQEMK
jgi:hypothetical protein